MPASWDDLVRPNGVTCSASTWPAIERRAMRKVV